MIKNYLLNRTNLMCLFVLIDSRHSAQKIDQDFMKWLSEKKVPFAMIFTKGDKLGKNMLANNIEKYKIEMLQQWEALPNIFITSAVKKKGLNEILKYIIDLNPQFEENTMI